MLKPIKKYINKIYSLHFNEENNQIYIYYNTDKLNSHNSIDVICGKNFHLLYTIKITKTNFETVTDLKFYEETQEFVICYFDKIDIHDFKGDKISTTNIEGVISSKYYDETHLLLELYEFSSNRSLGLFDTSKQFFKKYELESIGHYNRNFTIEKSNNLLFGLCNAYENRMYLHLLNFEEEALKIVCEKGLYCERNEIENASIEINSIGDEYMFAANDDFEKMTVCIYSVYNQEKPLREIPIAKEKIPSLHLLLDKYLVIEYKNKFGLLNLEIEDSLYNSKSRTFNFYEKDSHVKLSMNKIEGIITFVLNGELQIYKIDDAKLEIDVDRKDKMKIFIEKIKNNEFLMSAVDEFY